MPSTSRRVFGFLLYRGYGRVGFSAFRRFLGRARREVAVGGRFDIEFERIKRSCAELASQMRCPHHHKNARVEMAGESLDDFSMEVITCCEEFRRCVEDALETLLTHRV